MTERFLIVHLKICLKDSDACLNDSGARLRLVVTWKVECGLVAWQRVLLTLIPRPCPRGGDDRVPSLRLVQQVVSSVLVL